MAHSEPNINVLHAKLKGQVRKLPRNAYADQQASCRLTCFNAHKNQCSIINSKLEGQPQTQDSQTHEKSCISDVDQVPARSYPSVSELSALCAKHPSLRPLLQRLYRVARDSADTTTTKLPGHSRQAERQFEASLRALNNVLVNEGEDAAALTAFMELMPRSQNIQVSPHDSVS